MLNIRTAILSVVLVVILLLAVSLVAARTEVVPNPAGKPVSVPDNSEASADPRVAPIASYRSKFGVCFDVPISEAAACRSAGTAPAQSIRPPVDECFDVSISQLAGCRSASQKPAP